MAMIYNSILLASDGSEAAEAATHHAMEIADAFDATLHIVYVLDAAERLPTDEDPAEHPDLEARRRRALVYPADLATNADIEVTTVAVRGSTSEALVTYASEHDVDLIVIGTQGRSGLDRIIVGSVAEKVVRTAPVPVVTVQPDQKVTQLMEESV